MNYYDSANKRLVFVESKPTSKFWDSIWKKQIDSKNHFIQKIDLLVTPTTKKFLNSKSKILEGGCGHGTYVTILNKAGYNCIGVDFAKTTVSQINKKYPELPIYFGDLTKLKFKNNSFDGYWSLGVIEHFYKGFDQVLSEMKRVIRKKGFVFVTFPYMSPLRKLKANLGFYPKAKFIEEPKNFYQFALDHKKVVNKFKKSGFKLVTCKPFDGFSGLKKEIPQLGFILNPISKYSQKNIFIAGIRFTISKCVEHFTSHAVLVVFQKI